MEKDINQLNIRLLVKEDRDKIDAFFRGLGEEGEGFFNINRDNEKNVYAFLDAELTDRIYWAAFAETDEGEEIAGIVFLWDISKKIPWLGIGITEKWKGRHLGRRLMAVARDYAEVACAGGICLTTSQKNLRGQGLYERMGYERLGVHLNGEFLYLLTFPNEEK